jgi:peptide/nickel transport system permease protein
MKKGTLPRFVLKRVLLSIPVLVGVVFFTFVIARIVVPNPARAWAGIKASQSYVDTLAARYHINDPIPLAFFYYISGYATGDWGVSADTHQPVLDLVSTFLPATIELTLAATILIIIFGVTLGVVAAVRKDKWPDHVSRVTALTGVSSPPFLASLILLLIFFYYLHWFPNGSRLDPGLSAPTGLALSFYWPNLSHLGQWVLVKENVPTGFYVLDSILSGNLQDFLSAIRHIALPAFALAATYFGITTRLVRSEMLKVLGEDYIRTAKSKGLRNSVVFFKHALRNALIPTTTIVALNFSALLGGAVVIEDIFNWPGMGRFTFQALGNLDYPVIIGTTLLFAIGVVLANTIADVLYGLLDPRIEVE